jgi:hypothetical protein
MKLEHEPNQVHQAQTLYFQAYRGGGIAISEIPLILSELQPAQVTACLWIW